MTTVKSHTRKTKKGRVRVRAHPRSKRKFLAMWGEGYVKQGAEIVTLGTFSDDMGYDEKDIKKVKELAVGKTLDLSDPSGIHKVKRIR